MSNNNFDKELYINRINTIMEENGILVEEIDSEEDLNLDSLTQVSLLVCFEDEFGFEFSEDDLVDVPQTYNGLVQFVLKNIACLNDSKEQNAIFLSKGGESIEKET